MNQRYAVIDLGTNTFHLLIVESTTDGFEELHRERIFIKLAENGIETIGAAPFQRGLEALRHFKQQLVQYQVADEQIKVFGTAALRTASNGSDFIRQVDKETGIRVQLISGSQEADLIHKGVIQAVPLSSEKVLIMDIGGGSVEFIVADENSVIWAESFPIGVAVLYRGFHHNDPITAAEVKDLEAFLHKKLLPLEAILQQHETPALIGVSGTFDVLETYLAQAPQHSLYRRVQVEDFYPFYQKMLKTTLPERLRTAEIPAARAEMLIVALVLIDVVMALAKTQQIMVSPYAMKEGMLYDMIHA